MKKFRYDYYTVNIPSDCESDSDTKFDMAINVARENARLYVIPCEWRLINDDGENVKVCRIRCNRMLLQ